MDVINIPEGGIPPFGYIIGNPNANTGRINIGKRNFYNPITGHCVKTFECPTGYEDGSGKQWVTNGSESMLVVIADHTFDAGWYIGKTNKIHRAKNRNIPISTPLGMFDHPITFCEQYSCDISMFENLDSKIRNKVKNKNFLDELIGVNYDFNKSKAENGFKFI